MRCSSCHCTIDLSEFLVPFSPTLLGCTYKPTHPLWDRNVDFCFIAYHDVRRLNWSCCHLPSPLPKLMSKKRSHASKRPDLNSEPAKAKRPRQSGSDEDREPSLEDEAGESKIIHCPGCNDIFETFWGLQRHISAKSSKDKRQRTCADIWAELRRNAINAYLEEEARTQPNDSKGGGHEDIDGPVEQPERYVSKIQADFCRAKGEPQETDSEDSDDEKSDSDLGDDREDNGPVENTWDDYEEFNPDAYDWHHEEIGTDDEMHAAAEDVAASDPEPEGEDDAASVGDADGEPGDDDFDNRTETIPGAAKKFERDMHLFEKIDANDPHSKERHNGLPHYPFSCAMDWQMACTLDNLPISMASLDTLLQTDYVRRVRPP